MSLSSISGGVRVNTNGNVVKADIGASNGVIHLIDHVLIPARYYLSLIIGKKQITCFIVICKCYAVVLDNYYCDHLQNALLLQVYIVCTVRTCSLKYLTYCRCIVYNYAETLNKMLNTI